MQKFVHRIILCFLLPLLCGCAGQFSYNGVNFNSSPEALAAVRADLSKKNAAVLKSNTKIDGSVLVVVPTLEVIRNSGVVKYGAATEEQINYVADVLEMGFLSIPDFIKKGGVFDQVTVVRSADAGGYSSAGFDYKFWLLGISTTQWQWYLEKKDRLGKVPVSPDRGLAPIEVGSSFIEPLVRAARSFENPSVSSGEKKLLLPPPSEPNQTQPTALLDDAKVKCADLGFKAGTETFGECVIKLSR